MTDVFVHDFSLALGAIEHTLEDSVAAGRTHTGVQPLHEAGFRRHRVCSSEQNGYDLARAAVTPIAPACEGAGAIVYATCLPLNGNIGDPEQFRATRDVKYVMDFPVSHLQADFHLDRAAAIGLNQQACTSMLGSMRIARALLRDEPELGRILCVSSDRFPPGAEYEQAYNLISDGAAACVVSLQPRGYRIVACHQLTNGALARASDDETVGTYFSYTARLLKELLAKAKLTPKQIDWVVPQNTHIKSWTILGRLLGLPEERIFFRTIGEYGHIISSDNVANLIRLEQEKAIEPGARLLLPMAGFGLNWQAVILEKV